MKSKLLLAIVLILTLSLSFFPAVPAKAAEPEVWTLTETIISPALKSKDGYNSWSVSGTSMEHRYRFPLPPNPADEHQQFTFTKPDDTLTPGKTVNLTVTGTGSSKYSGETFEYYILLSPKKPGGYFDYALDADLLASLHVGGTSGAAPKPPAKASFVVPPTTPDQKLYISAFMSTAGGESKEGFGVQWVYGVGKPKGNKLAVQHYPPFEYFQAGTGKNIKPAGDIVATLKDEKGKGIKGELVVFYVEPETPAKDEPGKNLYEVLATIPQAENKPPVRIKNETPGRKYLGGVQTDASGEARLNYLTEIGPKQFSGEILRQSDTFEEKGKISGTVWAGVWNQKTESLERLTPIPIEITAMAKILKISGKGRSDEFKQAWIKEYPEDAPWGEGRVRVKRILGFLELDYLPVEVLNDYLLMPGDILEIDSGVTVEIAWVTGDKVTARVPPKSEAKTSTERHERARLLLLTSASESGFHPFGVKAVKGIGNYVLDKFGLTVGKGVDFIVETLGVVGKVSEMGVDVYKGYQSIAEEMEDIDLSEIDIITRIRIRSTVIIDNTGEELKVYNLEGSPDIQTVAGGEVTLAEGKMITVSDEGVLGKVETFNVKEVEKEFYEREPAITRSESAGADSPTKATEGGSPQTSLPGALSLPRTPLAKPPKSQTPSSKTSSGVNWYLIAGGITFVWLIVLLVRRKGKQK